MDNIQTLRSKLNLIPLPIRSWFASEETSSMVQTINEHFKVQESDRTVIPKLLLRLEAKDLQPDYFAGELSGELKIDRDKALGISAEVQRVILGPVKKDFADIGIDISLLEKFQIPAIKDLNPTNPTGTAPIIIQDIGTSVASSAPKPVSIPTNMATSQTINAAPSLKTVAVPNNLPPVADPKSSRLSDIGWSRSRTADPVVKLDITQPLASAPKPAQPAVSTPSTPAQLRPTAAPQQQPAPALGKSPLSEFDRLNALKNIVNGSKPPAATVPSTPVPPAITATVPTPKPAQAPTPVPGAIPVTPEPTKPAQTTPAAPAASTEPAPFILHEDTSYKAQVKNADFTLSKPGTTAQVQMGPIKAQSPTRPAVLEFGNGGTPSPKPGDSDSKVVHYTQFGASLSSAPTENSGPRKVEQVMSPAPSPAPTAAPGTVPLPRPPQASQPAQPAAKEKVIVKDFL
jgi:hypothetical protein